MKIFHCILSGGNSERLWPVTGKDRPKQFSELISSPPLFVKTYQRLLSIAAPEDIFILSNKKHVEIALDLMPQLSRDRFIIEPSSKDTMAAIALAAHTLYNIENDALMFIYPSDHVISDEDSFTKVMSRASKFIFDNGGPLVFGIQPTGPNTSFGYIEYNNSSNDKNVHPVTRFIEKPKSNIARDMIDKGNFLWNSGIYGWKLSSIIKDIDIHAPEIAKSVKDVINKKNIDAWHSIDPISIDYSLIEKLQNISVIKVDFGWTDLGTWGSYYDISEKDCNMNTLIGDASSVNSKRNLIISNDRSTAVYGIEDLIVIHYKDKTLIAPRSKSNEIKKLIRDGALDT